MSVVLGQDKDERLEIVKIQMTICSCCDESQLETPPAQLEDDVLSDTPQLDSPSLSFASCEFAPIDDLIAESMDCPL